MSDIPGSRNKIQLEATLMRAGVSESLAQALGSAVNELLDGLDSPGTFRWSALDEATFQSIHGNKWILADGRSVPGSDYSSLTGFSNAPDVRGRTLRGKDHGAGVNPDGDTAVNTLQGDLTGTHTHPTLYNGSPSPYPVLLLAPGQGLQPNNASPFQVADAILSIGNGGGAESRMKNTTENCFVKINW